MNSFKPVKHMVVSLLYKKWGPCDQRRKKNFAFIKGIEWPVKMATSRENMLKRTELYEKLAVNHGSDGNVLSCLLVAYCGHYTDKVDEHLGCQELRANFFLEVNQSLKMNDYERNFGSFKADSQNLSCLAFPSVGIINKRNSAVDFETMPDVLDVLEKRGLFSL